MSVWGPILDQISWPIVESANSPTFETDLSANGNSNLGFFLLRFLNIFHHGTWIILSHVLRFLLPKCSVCSSQFSSPIAYEKHIATINHIKRKSLLADRNRENEDGDSAERSELNESDFLTLDEVRVKICLHWSDLLDPFQCRVRKNHVETTENQIAFYRFRAAAASLSTLIMCNEIGTKLFVWN